MAWRMVKQPNGTYARWSDVVDGFTAMNMSRREALALCRNELGSLEAEQKVKRADLDEQTGGRPGTGADRWAECLTSMAVLGKKAEADEAMKLDREFKPEPEPELPPLKLDRLAIMFSEPQTLICTTDGIGIATVHGDTREEREQIARWLVEKVNGPDRCRCVWRAGVLRPPDEPVIPDGARCVLPPHGEDVAHKFEG
jgi:hypothetical protein